MTISVDVSAVKTQMQREQQALDHLAQDAYSFFVAHTPYRSGNARRRTRLDHHTITGDYPYAERLDNGWSRQAPQGMTDPTEAWIAANYQRYLGQNNG